MRAECSIGLVRTKKLEKNDSKPIPLVSICWIPAIKSSHSDWYCTESSLFALFASVKSPVITTTSGLINFSVWEQKMWKSFVRCSSWWVEIWMSDTWTKWTNLSSDSPFNVQHHVKPGNHERTGMDPRFPQCHNIGLWNWGTFTVRNRWKNVRWWTCLDMVLRQFLVCQIEPRLQHEK